MDFFCLELEAKNLQQSMDDIKSYIANAVESVSNVDSNNLENSNEIYYLLKSSVEARKTRKLLLSVIKKVVFFRELLKD